MLCGAGQDYVFPAWPVRETAGRGDRTFHPLFDAPEGTMMLDSVEPAEYVRRVLGTARARGQEVQAWSRAHSFAEPWI